MGYRRIAIYLLLFMSCVLFSVQTYELLVSGPPVWNDEAILTDVAKHVQTSGTLTATILKNEIPGIDEHFYFYPPLYMTWLSIWIRVFGASIVSVRMNSVFWAGIAGVLFWLCLKKITRSPLAASAGLFLLVGNTAFGIASRTARMEIMVVACMFAVLLAILHERYILAGWFAAAAVMIHPLGILGLCIGVVGVLEKRSWKSVVSVFLPSVFCVMIWLLSMGTTISACIYQYGLQFSLKVAQQTDLVNQFTYNALYVWSLVFGCVLVCALAYKALRTKNYLYWVVISGVIVSFVGALVGKEFWFDVYPHVWLVMVAACLIFERKLYIVIFLFSLSTFGISVRTYVDFRTWTLSYATIGKRIASVVPHGSHVFIAAIPDPYFMLQYDTSLTLQEAPPVPISIERYRQVLSEQTVVIYTRIPDSFFEDYMKRNAEKTVNIKAGNVTYTIVTLRLKEKRQ